MPWFLLTSTTGYHIPAHLSMHTHDTHKHNTHTHAHICIHMHMHTCTPSPSPHTYLLIPCERRKKGPTYKRSQLQAARMWILRYWPRRADNTFETDRGVLLTSKWLVVITEFLHEAVFAARSNSEQGSDFTVSSETFKYFRK